MNPIPNSEIEPVLLKEYLEAWMRDFPQSAIDWIRDNGQVCPSCLDSTCEGEC